MATQSDLRHLIEEMWDDDPNLRPPFEMIKLRLEEIMNLFAESVHSTGSEREAALKKEKFEAAVCYLYHKVIL